MLEMICPRPCDWSVPGAYQHAFRGQTSFVCGLPSLSTMMVGVWPPKDILVVFQHNRRSIECTRRRLGSQDELLCERSYCDMSPQNSLVLRLHLFSNSTRCLQKFALAKTGGSADKADYDFCHLSTPPSLILVWILLPAHYEVNVQALIQPQFKMVHQ